MNASTPHNFELRFQSFDRRQCFAFPCDPKGRVEMNLLSDRERINYLYARAMVGRDLAAPAMRPMGLH